jgi:hypothetical protein
MKLQTHTITSGRVCRAGARKEVKALPPGYIKKKRKGKKAQ